MAGLSDSCRSGDRVAALRDLRDLLAQTIVSSDSARDVAALSRQLVDVLAQIDAAQGPAQVGTALDELRQRRSSRGAKTAG